MEAKVRVLIVEDDEVFCKFLAEILERKGMQVVWTTDALEGLKKSQSYPGYDLFILDVRMPMLLGTEIAWALKQNKPKAKVILISGFADESLRELASKLGTPIMSKPFSAHDLLQVIDDSTPGSV
jgi:two-component system response regulator RegA